MTGWRVAEIGGGYGGQAKVLMDVAQISHYSIWDVPQANALQSRYLKDHFHKTNVSFHSSFDEAAIGVGDRVDANWASQGLWYPGKVVTKVVDGHNELFTIKYDDGDSELRVEASRVRREELQFDLVISNYAVSELAEKDQLVYAEKLISKAKHAFLTINGGVSSERYITQVFLFHDRRNTGA